MPFATTECVGARIGTQVTEADLLQFRLKACGAIPLVDRQRMVVIIDAALGNARKRRQNMLDPGQRGDAGIALGFQ
ncbi:hypothetical protein D3C81_1253480 [compost metagenome]